MLYLLLALLFMLPGSFLFHYLIHMAAPMRHPILFSTLGTLQSAIIWSINHILLPQPSLSLGLLLFLIDYILIRRFTEKGQRGLACLVYALLSIIQLLVSLVVMVIMIRCLHIDPMLIAVSGSPIYPPSCLITGILSCLAMYLFLRLFNRILPPLRENRLLVAFSILFFTQVFAIYLFSHFFVYGSTISGLALTAFITLSLYIISGFFFLSGYQALRQLDLAQLWAQQIEQELRLQVDYYRQLQNDILKINQVRHDLSNQLQAAYYLLENGDREQVRQQLDELNSQIRKKVGTCYCSNLIVDAILTSKASLCEESGIPLSLSVFLPSELPIETSHLCSIFSNILDNGIHATQETARPFGLIELSGDVHGGYVTIKSSNPSLPVKNADSKDPMRTHGLGLAILESIAHYYNGNLQTRFKDGRFELVLLLKIP